MNLIEREAELAELWRLFTGALEGRGAVAVVSAPVATGKTALLRAFTDRVTGSGAILLHAAASPAEYGAPLAALLPLLSGTDLPAGARQEIKRLLDEGIGPAVLPELCQALVRTAARSPLVIVLDDLQLADATSLRFLLSLTHRIASARILLVLAERSGPGRRHHRFHADLSSQPHCRRLRLAQLSARGQERLLTSRLGATAGRRLAATCHAVTGGNPLLVQAVLKDNRLPAVEPVVDAAFQQALLGCLYRGGPAMVRIARVLAILREPPAAALIARLVGLDAAQATETIEAMNAAGLLDGGRFRHPAARAAVLDGMAADERATLHCRAARLLHDYGAAAAAVAGHILAAAAEPCAAGPTAAEPWALPVLAEAGEQALAEGRLHTALACLRLAHDVCLDEQQRAGLASTLARAEWRIGPSGVNRLLPSLILAAGKGWLGGDPTVRLLGYLLWYGRMDEAVDVLRRLSAPGAARPRGTGRDLAATRLLLSCFAPDVVERALPGWDATADRAMVSTAGNRHLRAAGTLAAVLAGETSCTAMASVAEQVLQGARLGDTPKKYILAALAALLYGDRPDEAARRCDLLLAQVPARRDTVAHAALTAVRAAICLRQGDLLGAERHARTALSRLSPAGWGVAIGLPISVMVSATSAMGRYTDAATYLGVAVPEAMFQTLCGVHYLHARGRYYLATGHAPAALADFHACGELIRRWGFDVPGLIAWRTEAARARLALGDASRAAELVEEQLAMERPGPSRTRGAALHVQAMTAEPCRRRELLGGAVAVLEHSGDQYELALALGSLSEVQAAAGEHELAAASAQDARRLAERGGVRLPDPPGAVPAAAAQESVADTDPGAALTEAERKVAALAAQGYTNRQIAGQLLITVSTVEQHLTRVYRKLNVNRRTDLRPKLASGHQRA
jgi:DNA-binding CsgD family transcriptional regulator